MFRRYSQYQTGSPYLTNGDTNGYASYQTVHTPTNNYHGQLTGATYAAPMLSMVYPSSTPELRIKTEQIDADAQDNLQSLGNAAIQIVTSLEKPAVYLSSARISSKPVTSLLKQV